MLKQSSFGFSFFGGRSKVCLLCQYQIFRSSARRNASSTSPPPKVATAPSTSNNGEFIPRPLNRPLGLSIPPSPGQNTGIDLRTWKQRRDDFVNYDKHIERRKQLTTAVAKPYFREWTNMRYQKGKTFIAPSKLFRADKALYFPNLHGVTLASPRDLQDTTAVLEDRVSVVSVFSGTWAERQTATFVNEHDNKELHKTLKEGKQVAQQVRINIEENALKAWLIQMFMPGLRRRIPQHSHGKYFVIRKGITEEIKDKIGLLNSKVGYVYLVDRHCKIRWAGSGRAEPSEKESLVRGVSRLVEEWKREGGKTKVNKNSSSLSATDSALDAAEGIVH